MVRAVFYRLVEWVVSGAIRPETTAVFALQDIRAAFATVPASTSGMWRRWMRESGG
jgi:hypothetical protein